MTLCSACLHKWIMMVPEDMSYYVKIPMPNISLFFLWCDAEAQLLDHIGLFSRGSMKFSILTHGNKNPNLSHYFVLSGSL